MSREKRNAPASSFKVLKIIKILVTEINLIYYVAA